MTREEAEKSEERGDESRDDGHTVLIYMSYVYWAKMLNTSANLCLLGEGPLGSMGLGQLPFSPHPRAGSGSINSTIE